MTAVFAFHSVALPGPGDLAEGLFLVVLRPERIPPHLGLLCGNNWFTLDVQGPLCGGDSEKLLRAIERKKITTLFVQLAWPRGLSKEKAGEWLGEIFSAYPALGPEGATCFSPIRDFCCRIYGNKYQDTQFVYQLLRKLEQDGLLAGNYGLHTGEKAIALSAYTMDDVRAAIRDAASPLPGKG